MNIGILLLTHNDIGAQLLLAAKSTYGSIPFRTELLSIDHYDQPTDLINLAQQYVKVLDSGDGVLILTDMFGSTPSNIAKELADQSTLPILRRGLKDMDLEIVKLSAALIRKFK